jgi:aminopeptidase
VLVEYCLNIQAGELLLIRAETVAEPLVREVLRLAARRGAHPHLTLSIPEQGALLLKEMPDSELDYVSPLRAQEVEHADAELTIMSSANSQDLSGIDPARVARRQLAYKPIRERWMARALTEPAALRWCGTLFPTYSEAQDAHMSLSDYEAFVYHAMRLDEPDPVATWRAQSALQDGYAAFLAGRDEVRIVAEDTDIRMRTKGRRWINDDAHLNFPGGEVFTGPIEETVEGHIRYTYPTVFQGREAEDVHLWFEDGIVTRWEARRGKELLDEMFAMDPGARRLGEFAIGTNYGVPTFTKSILFDEKIGGTCHLAVGNSIPLTGGVNQSALHWDMVCDLRQGGVIYSDGEPLLENGQWKI